MLDKLSFTFDDLGAREMKNIARPIEVYRVALGSNLAGGPTKPALRPRPLAHEPPSIAVLPFVNMSHEADEYFADGLAEELLNVLSKIRGLRVAARSSAFTFKGKGATVAEVGRALNVATVLEGSVRKAGNRLRISVQLVKVADGYHLWSERYDRTLEDIFAVQDDIAQSVVKELRATLLGEAVDAQAASALTAQVAAAVKGRATDPEAHRLFLQARYFLDRRNRDDTTKAIGYVQQALERDPAFALAWTELSRAYTLEADMGWGPVVEGYARGREAVARALALEPDLAEGHGQLGWIQMIHDWDWRGAEASFTRALALAPRDAGVLRVAGTLARCLGRVDEALGLYRRAIEQDPLSSASYQNLGYVLAANGDLMGAEQAHRKAFDLVPQRTLSRAYLALNLLAQGRGEEALAEASCEPEEWARLRGSAIIEHATGDLAAADAALRELIAKYAESSAVQIAEVYAAHGETDLAFAWLDRAYVQRDGGLPVMKLELSFRRLHADPRWGAFLRKMGLPE